MDRKPRPASAPVHNPRLTVVSSVHYDSGDGPTDSIEHRHGRFLTCKEQMWRRRQQVTPEWSPLDLGWFDEKPMGVGTVILSIESPPSREVLPQVEVGLVPHTDDDHSAQPIPFAYLFPGSPSGDPLRLNPVLPQHLRMRCPGGEVMVTVYVLPR